MVRFARVASSNLAPHFVLPNTGGNIVSIHERRRFLDRPRGLPIAGCTRAERWHNGTDWHGTQGALMALFFDGGTD
jgi:hypothetical protein